MPTCPGCGNGIPQPLLPYCPHCGTPVAAATPSEAFKPVTIVFCDVVKSTQMGRQLDDLPMRRVMDEYGKIVRQVFGSHGGTVGRRHGDGFMIAFGIPELHEDDALRAVRAAHALRIKLQELDAKLWRERELSLKVRVGVNTGTVLVRDAGALEDEVNGDPVTIAKRFEQAAETDQILIGAETYRLVAAAVDVGKSQEIIVDGIPEPQTVWPLLEVNPDQPARVRRLDAPLIGRQREQALLSEIFKRVVDERLCHLVTVLGFAGVGKSRLVDEFVNGLGEEATVLNGHCLEYGDSTALWPMVQIVRQAAGVAPTASPDQVNQRLVELVRDQEVGELVAARLAQVLGFGFERQEDLREDTVWALRLLLQALAGDKPLVVVVDDLHWAEPTLLDALENIAETAQDAPIMLICLARSDELFPRRQWPGAKENYFAFRLSPLREAEGEQLVGHLLDGQVDPEAQTHISEWAQGFPLIVEELVANLRDEGKLQSTNGRWRLQLDAVGDEHPYPGAGAWEQTGRTQKVSVPTSIKALLLPRLGRLDATGQAIIERAAVVGEQFHRLDIEVLSPDSDSADLAASLDELVRLDFVRRDRSPAAVPLPTGSGEGYRFRHIMIRSVAYERMPDDRRAELHERYAAWLEQNTEDRRSQFDELVGYHLFEAYRYAKKLDPSADHTSELARRTGERHADAGLRAAIRGDNQLTVTWLGRAARLLPADHPTRLEVLGPLAEALQASGELKEAMRAYDDIASAARAAGDDGLAARATIGRLAVAAQSETERFLDEGREAIEAEIPVFDRLEDQLGLAKAHYLLAYRNWAIGHLAAARLDAEKARAFALEAKDSQWEARIISLLGLILYWGPTSLDEVERHSKEAVAFARRTGVRALEADALTVLARIAAMRGQFDDARQQLAEARAVPIDLALLTQSADVVSEALIHLLSEKLAEAEDILTDADARLQEQGGVGPRVAITGLLARVLLLRGRIDEAEKMTRTCEQIAADHQVDAQVKWRAIRAVILARRRELNEAERLVKEAVDLADESDQIDSRAEAHVDLAEVLRLGGRLGEAARELEFAIYLYKQKGNQVAERNARKLRSRLLR
jgi:predicted ATPase/class 3 adenylate cyclase